MLVFWVSNIFFLEVFAASCCIFLFFHSYIFSICYCFCEFTNKPLPGQKLGHYPIEFLTIIHVYECMVAWATYERERESLA